MKLQLKTPMVKTINVTSLRHGRSRADDENVHEGRYDSPLTEVGRTQVHKRAADFLQRGLQFDAIIASTLQRANETAHIIGSALGVAVENDPDWMGSDNGPLAGLPFDVAKQRYPKPAFRTPYTPMAGSGGNPAGYIPAGSQKRLRIWLSVDLDPAWWWRMAVFSILL